MMTITIEDENLITALTQAAQYQATTIEAIVKQALQWQFPLPSATEDSEPTPCPLDEVELRKRYPFIGKGHSGKKNISTQAEEILMRDLDPVGGWRIPA